MRIAVASCYVGVDGFRREFEPNRIAYCQRHGYAYLRSNSLTDAAFHPAWEKIALILRNLKDFDWIWWLDADAVISDMVRPVEPIIIQNGGADRVECVIGIDWMTANCGSFFVKNTPAVHDFLGRVWERRRGPLWFPGVWEQSAFLEQQHATPELITICGDHERAFNRYYQPWAPGSGFRNEYWQNPTDQLVVHVPGLPWWARTGMLREVFRDMRDQAPQAGGYPGNWLGASKEAETAQ